jgi:hypothetical protein
MDMNNQIDTLLTIVNDFSIVGTRHKQQLLEEINGCKKFNNKALIKYHDCLLFLLAYPDDNTIYQLATHELARLISMVSNYSTNKKISLSGSGLPGTTTICSYSFELSKWLSNKYGKEVDIESSSADTGIIRETIRLLFPEPEYWQTTQDELSIDKRIKLLKDKADRRNNLSWLISQFSKVGYSKLLTEYLYSNLKLYVSWQINTNSSRSYLRGLKTQVYYHRDLIKNINTGNVIDKALPYPRKLNKSEKEVLCDTAKSSLALLYRETDPVTYSDLNEVVCFELERGISVVLYGMKIESRFSMESYIGYMAYKNGFPMAYGGGWMLGSRCKIGVNIYEPYRRGESAFVFSQIIRVYKEYYGMERFVVKPYQFGKGNPEGIKSGAYWFYYKLGFRSVDKEIAMLATKEWNEIIANKSYRTHEKVLKKFTGSNIELMLKANVQPDFDASEISKAVTRMINERYQGDRKKAIKETTNYVFESLGIKYQGNGDELKHFQQMCLWFALIPDLHKWSKNEKTKLGNLIKLKTSDNERNYILNLKANKKLWAALQYVL